VKDVDYVRDEIVKTFGKYAKELIPAKQLNDTRSRQRYAFSMAMNSNDAIAGTLAAFVALRRSPGTIDKMFALYDSVTPEDVRFAAAKYFVPNNQTVVTLTAKNGGAK
jgi:zinc protease